MCEESPAQSSSSPWILCVAAQWMWPGTVDPSPLQKKLEMVPTSGFPCLEMPLAVTDCGQARQGLWHRCAPDCASGHRSRGPETEPAQCTSNLWQPWSQLCAPSGSNSLNLPVVGLYLEIALAAGHSQPLASEQPVRSRSPSAVTWRNRSPQGPHQGHLSSATCSPHPLTGTRQGTQ